MNKEQETIPVKRLSDYNHRFRLAALVSHPIQYQAPLFRALNQCKEIDLTVLFCSDWGHRPRMDEGFGKVVEWDVPLLDGYRYEFLPNRSPKPHPSYFWGLMNPSIVRRLKNGRFDAVWVHSWYGLTNCLAMLTALTYKIPLLLRGDNTLLHSLPLWKAFLKPVILSRLFKRTSACLAVGRYNAEFYRAYGVPQEKIFLVPYAVHNEFFIGRATELCPRKHELRRNMGIQEDMRVVLFVAKLLEHKRPMDLLKAFEAVAKNTRVALVYVGDGAQRNELEAYTRSNALPSVYFTGFKNQTELPAFYAMADLFVLTSGFEPWGLVVNEAMCFGLPVIVSDQVGSGGDLVQEGHNGFIVSVGDIATLTNRIKELVLNDRLRWEMGAISRKIIDQWGYSQDVEGILSCLRTVSRFTRH